MKSLHFLEKEIEEIKVRNKRVEADKAWELSGTRTAFISITTFSYGKLKSWWLRKQKE